MCVDCEQAPHLLALNGLCGAQDAPGPLPLLVGDPIARCPAAVALERPEVAALARLLPSAYGPGELADAPRHTLPPLLRSALALADAWLAEWKRSAAATTEAER